ncbi:MAG TPA: hypothetical protein VK935_07595, partial [Actinomycetospora sp.]|nr:hypothetical protein [Actinomycetospora sp.]
TSSDRSSAGRADVPESLEPPVVAVLPSFPVPHGPLDPETPTGRSAAAEAAPAVDEGHDDVRPRRRFGLRRPRD